MDQENSKLKHGNRLHKYDYLGETSCMNRSGSIIYFDLSGVDG